MSRALLSRLLRSLALGVALTLALPAARAPRSSALAQEPMDENEQAEAQKLVKLMQKGDKELQEKKLDEALKHYEKLFERLGKSTVREAVKKEIEQGARYNYACGLSLSGKKDEAIKALQRAIELGFSDWKHIQEDPDLETLRGEDAFKKAVEGCKSAAKKADEEALKTDDPGANTKLPMNPFESAKKGDWSVMVGTISIVAGGEKHEQTIGVSHSVEACEGGEVTSREEEKVKGSTAAESSKEHTFSTKEAPTIGRLFTFGKDVKVTDVKTADEKKTVGGREFSCTKLSFNLESTGNGEKGSVSVWLAKEVKANALVAEVLEMKDKGGTIKVDLALAGFGSADKADWGKDKATVWKTDLAGEPADDDEPDKGTAPNPPKGDKGDKTEKPAKDEKKPEAPKKGD